LRAAFLFREPPLAFFPEISRLAGAPENIGALDSLTEAASHKGGLFRIRNPEGRAGVFSLEEALMEEEPKTKLDKAMAAVKEVARKLKGENDSEPVPVETPVEDAFTPPDGEIKHEAPPKDPEAPSGSLSADGEKTGTVDLTPAPPQDTRP
jgi:hypothetical protein